MYVQYFMGVCLCLCFRQNYTFVKYSLLSPFNRVREIEKQRPVWGPHKNKLSQPSTSKVLKNKWNNWKDFFFFFEGCEKDNWRNFKFSGQKRNYNRKNDIPAFVNEYTTNCVDAFIFLGCLVLCSLMINRVRFFFFCLRRI